MGPRVGALALLAVAVTLASPARAHDRRIGHVAVLVDGDDVTLRLQVRALDLTALTASGVPDALEAGPDFQRFLRENLRVARGGRPCAEAARPAVAEGTEHRLAIERRLHCGSRGAFTLASSMHESIATYLVFVRARDVRSGRTVDAVLGERDDSVTLFAPRDSAFGAVVARFFRLGVEHLVTGYDHLAFLFVLLAACSRLRQAVWAVTGFTVGHALTLSLATLGVVVAEARAVEALIALTLLLAAWGVGLPGSKQGPRLAALAVVTTFFFSGAGPLASSSLPWAVLVGGALFACGFFAFPRHESSPPLSLAFGCVHGLGFASALGATPDASFSRAELAPALLGFNLGIEAAQLAALLLFAPVLVLASANPARLARLHAVAALAVSAAGTYGLFAR